MAAKRTIRYRGQTIRVWDKSYAINSEPVRFVGDLPCVKDIKRQIDERIAARGEPFALVDRTKPKPSLRKRLVLSFDDMRDQVPIGWICFGCFVAGSLFTAAAAWAIATYAL